jgi:transcriptional regulator with XRE-family HTH domain
VSTYLFRIWNNGLASISLVPNTLEKQLSLFLRQKRGGMTFARFSKKVGLPPSTLHRLEQCQQSISLRGLYQIMRRLNCNLSDIFPKEAGP